MPRDRAKAVMESSTSTTGDAGADGFAGQMDQHQAGLLAVGQSQLDEFAGRGVDGGAGLDAKRSVALLAVPFADVVAGVLVGDAALALDGVQEIDPVRRVGADRGRSVKETLLVSGKYQPCEILGHVRPTRQFR